MPIAILEVDLQLLPSVIRVGKDYERALILIRLNGAPIGQVTLPVADGIVIAPDLQAILLTACGWRYWQERLTESFALTPDDLPASPPPSATIAVCTRERPEDLQVCLAALSNLPNDGQEVLVIDNAPRSDATRLVVARFPTVRYVREDRPGLDRARNRALREARHEIVAFIDDDARADQSWLRALLASFGDPLVFCVTGLTMPAELETPAQEWFERESPFSRGFDRRVFTSVSHNPLHAGPMGAGVNMAVRREVLPRLDGFDEALDAGTPTQSGGDHNLFTRVLAAGYRVVYAPSALVWHRHRREWPELVKALRGYGTGVYAAWTRSLFRDRELKVPLMAWGWFRHEQLPHLVRSLARRPNRRSLRLLLAELWGCALGPWSYLRSYRRARREEG